MKDNWEERVSCATECPRCSKKLDPKDQRILSVYDDQTICMECKKKEEERPDGRENTSSTYVFHSPQDEQRPIHLEDSAPQF